jgi:hypothetical protein
MSKKQIIEALAKRYTNRRFGSCSGVHAMSKAAHRGAIIQYAKNYLAQHGSLPEGVHVCTARAHWISGVVRVEVDFNRLLNDPDYPPSHRHVPRSSVVPPIAGG